MDAGRGGAGAVERDGDDDGDVADFDVFDVDVACGDAGGRQRAINGGESATHVTFPMVTFTFPTPALIGATETFTGEVYTSINIITPHRHERAHRNRGVVAAHEAPGARRLKSLVLVAAYCAVVQVEYKGVPDLKRGDELREPEQADCKTSHGGGESGAHPAS